MADIGPGERSARRVLAADSALLIVLVLAVHFSFVAQGTQGNFPLWAMAIGFASATVTLAAGILAKRVSDRSLRALTLVAVAGYWATLVTFPAAVPDEGISRIPWTLTASAAAAAAALVAGGRTLAWVTVAAGAIAGICYRTLYGGLDLDGAVNDVHALLTGAVVCVIGGHMLNTGRRLDIAATSRSAAASRESAERGRLAARTRAAALVHDEVLATLTLAASSLPFPRDLLATQARDAVTMVSSLTDDQANEPVGLRAALAEEARQCGAAFTVRGDSALLSSVARPDAVAMHDAFVRATRQALRNSVQHAPDAARSVTLTLGDADIQVEIVDDGPGFTPATIADDRLGIRQSILGRMSRVEGGSAEVRSRPGAGTTIRLRYSAASAEDTEDTDNGAPRLGVAVVAVAYVASQAVCAAIAAVMMPGSWPVQAVVLVIALLAAEVLRRSPHRLPSPARSGVVVTLACSSFIIGALGVHFSDGMSYAYGPMWFTVACAFLLVAFALRGRIFVALGGLATMLVVLVAAGVYDGVPAGLIVQVSARPVLIVGLAVALIALVVRVQREINALHRDAAHSAARASWTHAGRAELAGRVAELARTVVPLLERIGAGGPVTDGQRLEYARCEGELRDGLRAGSLASEPLTTAVAAARARGVDVLLLDDSDDSAADTRIGDPADMGPILLWMTAAIATAQTRAVGRLLPHGRAASATITVDGRRAEFALQSADQPSVMSFQGE